MKIILDCNILIAAGLKDGTCRALLKNAVTQNKLFLSDDILLEYLLVSRRKKFQSHTFILEQMILLATNTATVVYPKKTHFKLPDPDDLKYLDLAMEVHANYLITGNKKDFPDSPYGHTGIISPSEFLLSK